ncbi:MAG: LysM peptidoglycan-binding domain-containing protein [Paenibacillus sp.]|nr:LysM peptidoglycan-binding domain-containing protein [Paenibacillus sp.]
MFDQSHGLRFDIYERIHLSEELPGIAELEEVELLPEIQVIQREDRAELYGQLLLTGLYRGEDDRIQRLEHAIPVEITVPLTRVSSLEDIGVEIENFDIDLLTMRSLNITGVLSLRGIGGSEAIPAPIWQQDEYTVAYTPEAGERDVAEISETHERESDALYENSLWTFGEGEFDESVEVQKANAEAIDNHEDSILPAQDRDTELKVHTHSLDSDSNSSSSPFNPSDYWKKAAAWDLGTAPNGRNDSVSAEATTSIDSESANEVEVFSIDVSEAENTTFVDDVQSEAHSTKESTPNTNPAAEQSSFDSAEVAPVPEEKPDLKIALGTKKEPKADENEHLTFSSLLNSSRTRKEQEDLHSEEVISAAATAAPDSGNDKEWKSRFIGGVEGPNLFRKVRLCIVQREETLDTIADKYQLSTRELVMYNRLSGQTVEEGQVLYIP